MESFDEVSALFLLNETQKLYVDALPMFMVRQPDKLKSVIVVPNLFGDILTNLGIPIQGGLGIAPSANINPNGASMFEPVHGSSPELAGKNIANSIAAILSGALILDYLGFNMAARVIEEKVSETLKMVRLPHQI